MLNARSNPWETREGVGVGESRNFPYLMRLTISMTRSHCLTPTWEGPLQAAPMQKRVLPDSRARKAAWEGKSS